MSARPFAVFDIDGTLIRWQLYHALADELAHNGLIEQKAFGKVRAARMVWKNRGSESSFNDYERTMIELIDGVMAGMQVAEVEAASQAVITRYKDQVYTYTRDLIQSLRAENYLLFAISGSQADIVKLLARYYQFDDYGGSEYEVKGGSYTGKKSVLKHDKKPDYLKMLVEKHQATWQGSVGIGDSESDIPMLSSVKSPIAFNPTKALFAHAKEHHWPVVVERKNMVYRLSPDGNGYQLEPREKHVTHE